MTLYNTLHLIDENKNDERIEIIVDDFVEASFAKTDANVTEAFEFVEEHKADADPDDDPAEYIVWVLDPRTNEAEIIEDGVFYNFDSKSF